MRLPRTCAVRLDHGRLAVFPLNRQLLTANDQPIQRQVFPRQLLGWCDRERSIGNVWVDAERSDQYLDIAIVAAALIQGAALLQFRG